MYIKFEDGTQFTLLAASGAPALVAGHRRDVVTLTLSGTYAAVKAAFNGQPWAHYFATGDSKDITDLAASDEATGEYVRDYSGYQLVAGITDNMDGTVTVRVGRSNTREESLEDELAAEQAKSAALENDKAALTEENAALAAENQDKDAQIDDLVVAMLEGGTDDVSETAETV